MRIYLSPPHTSWREMCYVHQAFESNWIAPLGEHVDKFEQEVREATGAPYALAVSSGTAAIHLALRSAGVKAGDIVLCSDMTFIGSANPILYLGARPVFIDSQPDSLNMSPQALKRALSAIYARGDRVAAVIIVDLYGISADYDELLPICDEYGVPVIEDAAEALGASYKGVPCGNFGYAATLSFNGNKIITTSGGGMVLSNDASAIDKMRFWATQAREDANYYYHREMGYNYRLSNICAAIGRGQMEVLRERIEARARLRGMYERALNGSMLSLLPIPEYCSANYWMNAVTIDDSAPITPETILAALEANDIEGRRLWKPMHDQPLFEGCEFYEHEPNERAVSSRVFDRGLCLPSGSAMSDAQIERVIRSLKNAI